MTLQILFWKKYNFDSIRLKSSSRFNSSDSSCQVNTLDKVRTLDSPARTKTDSQTIPPGDWFCFKEASLATWDGLGGVESGRIEKLAAAMRTPNGCTLTSSAIRKVSRGKILCIRRPPALNGGVSLSDLGWDLALPCLVIESLDCRDGSFGCRCRSSWRYAIRFVSCQRLLVVGFGPELSSGSNKLGKPGRWLDFDHLLCWSHKPVSV